MSIETHITVAFSRDAMPALQRWLTAHHLRLDVIELARGRSPRQEMITTRADIDPEEALRRARQLCSTLPREIEAQRIKLEAPLATELGPTLYIEHHVKVRARPDQLPVLTALGERHGAHLSRNPYRVLEAAEERFLTQRFSPEAGALAEDHLRGLLDSLRGTPVTLLKIARERVLHDDNLLLDEGWSTKMVR